MSKSTDTALLIARLSILPLFLISASGKLSGFDALEATVAAKGLPAPVLFAILASLAEPVGALALGVGLFGRLAAAGLALYTLLVSLAIHNFWAIDGAAAYGQEVHFLKNIGLIGLFLALAIIGPGRFSLDHVWKTRRGPQAAGQAA